MLDPHSSNRGAVLLSVSPPLFVHVRMWNWEPSGIHAQSQYLTVHSPHLIIAKLYFSWFSWHNSIIIEIEPMFWKLTRNCTGVHCSEGSLKSYSWIAPIRAEIEPKRWPRWNYFTGGRQVSSEGHQQGTWAGGAVVNPQLVVVRFCVKVGKLHFDKEAVWYGDAPTTVLAVGVVVRVVRTCKPARILSTDGRRASWKRRPRG